MVVDRFKKVPKARAGDRVAVLSPAFAAPAVSAPIHEQALERLAELTGLIPVEYPTTRQYDASPEARAADLMQAFKDPTIRAILATIGGDDEITVIPHLTPDVLRANPKPFLGYSDNTHLHNLLWSVGVPSFYGGATQVHLGPGPHVDEVHVQSLRASLLDGGEIDLTDPGESEDFGLAWTDPRALTDFGEREPSQPWAWAGPESVVEGRTWGGCLEVIEELAIADRMPSVDSLKGSILLLETSEETPSAEVVARWVRALGERGIVGVVAGVLVANPPVRRRSSDLTRDERTLLRLQQRERVLEQITIYNPDAVVCQGVPFGHTRPQWIVPHGGRIRLDGKHQRVTADYN